MRLNRFYLENFAAEKIIILDKGAIFHQIKNVLRMKVGDQVSFFSDPQEALYQIEKIDNKKIQLFWQKNIIPQSGPKQDVFLFQSLIKKDKMEWVVQKAVELGVKKFFPIISERSEKKDINLERLEKIIIEASEQCGRVDLMKISQPIKFKEALKQKSEISFLGDLSGTNFSDLIRNAKKDHSTFSLFVGPEGGFSSAELQMAQEKNIKIGVLNNYTLRSETAAVAILSLIFNI